MKKFENLAAAMRDAVDHPEKYPEVKPEEKISKSPAPKKENGLRRRSWIKEHENRQDDDNRKF